MGYASNRSRNTIDSQSGKVAKYRCCFILYDNPVGPRRFLSAKGPRQGGFLLDTSRAIFFHQTATKLTQAGDGTAITRPVGTRSPDFLSIWKTSTLSES